MVPLSFVNVPRSTTSTAAVVDINQIKFINGASFGKRALQNFDAFGNGPFSFYLIWKMDAEAISLFSSYREGLPPNVQGSSFEEFYKRYSTQTEWNGKPYIMKTWEMNAELVTIRLFVNSTGVLSLIPRDNFVPLVNRNMELELLNRRGNENIRNIIGKASYRLEFASAVRYLTPIAHGVQDNELISITRIINNIGNPNPTITSNRIHNFNIPSTSSIGFSDSSFLPLVRSYNNLSTTAVSYVLETCGPPTITGRIGTPYFYFRLRRPPSNDNVVTSATIPIIPIPNTTEASNSNTIPDNSNSTPENNVGTNSSTVCLIAVAGAIDNAFSSLATQSEGNEGTGVIIGNDLRYYSLGEQMGLIAAKGGYQRKLEINDLMPFLHIKVLDDENDGFTVQAYRNGTDNRTVYFKVPENKVSYLRLDEDEENMFREANRAVRGTITEQGLFHSFTINLPPSKISIRFATLQQAKAAATFTNNAVALDHINTLMNSTTSSSTTLSSSSSSSSSLPSSSSFYYVAVENQSNNQIYWKVTKRKGEGVDTSKSAVIPTTITTNGTPAIRSLDRYKNALNLPDQFLKSEIKSADLVLHPTGEPTSKSGNPFPANRNMSKFLKVYRINSATEFDYQVNSNIKHLLPVGLEYPVSVQTLDGQVITTLLPSTNN